MGNLRWSSCVVRLDRFRLHLGSACACWCCSLRCSDARVIAKRRTLAKAMSSVKRTNLGLLAHGAHGIRLFLALALVLGWRG